MYTTGHLIKTIGTLVLIYLKPTNSVVSSALVTYCSRVDELYD